MIGASLLPPRSITDVVPLEDDLDTILLNVHAQGSVLAVKDGEPVFYPNDMKMLEMLEAQGYLRGSIVERISNRGHFRELTYHLTDSGITHCAALKLDN